MVSTHACIILHITRTLNTGSETQGCNYETYTSTYVLYKGRWNLFFHTVMESVIFMSNSQTIENNEIKQVVVFFLFLYDYEYKTSKFVHIVYYICFYCIHQVFLTRTKKFITSLWNNGKVSTLNVKLDSPLR